MGKRKKQVKQRTSTDKKKPARKPVKKPSSKPVKKPAAKPVKKPARKPVKKPAAKSVKKPARKPFKKPAAKPVKKPAAKPAKKLPPLPPTLKPPKKKRERKRKPPKPNPLDVRRKRSIKRSGRKKFGKRPVKRRSWRTKRGYRRSEYTLGDYSPETIYELAQRESENGAIGHYAILYFINKLTEELDSRSTKARGNSWFMCQRTSDQLRKLIMKYKVKRVIGISLFFIFGSNERK